MRFLVFNAVVVGALVVLFAAEGDRLQSITDTVSTWSKDSAETTTVVSVPVSGEVNTSALLSDPVIAENDATQADGFSALVETVMETVRQTEQATTNAAGRSEQAASRSEVLVAQTEALVAKLETLVEKAETSAIAAVSAVKEAALKPVASPAQAPEVVAAAAPKPAPVAKPATKLVPRHAPAKPIAVASATAPLPVQEVAQLQTHAVDYTKTVNRAQTAAQVAPTPAATPGVAIAEGEKLMTPRERRRELNALARDMESIFLRHAVN